MSEILLSILIPTVTGREAELSQLNKVISGQYKFHTGFCSETPDDINGLFGDEVEIVYSRDDKKMTIGEKRGRLYQKAKGLFSIMVDDDDSIADNAIEKILSIIRVQGKIIDCITFQELCTIDGKYYKSRHSLEYGDWEGDGQQELWDGFHFHRTPFFKSVIKTEIAKRVPIPHIRFGEDHQWAQALKPHLKTEVHIPEEIYIYQHQSSDFNTRYGFDRN